MTRARAKVQQSPLVRSRKPATLASRAGSDTPAIEQQEGAHHGAQTATPGAARAARHKARMASACGSARRRGRLTPRTTWTPWTVHTDQPRSRPLQSRPRLTTPSFGSNWHERTLAQHWRSGCSDCDFRQGDGNRADAPCSRGFPRRRSHGSLPDVRQAQVHRGGLVVGPAFPSGCGGLHGMAVPRPPVAAARPGIYMESRHFPHASWADKPTAFSAPKRSSPWLLWRKRLSSRRVLHTKRFSTPLGSPTSAVTPLRRRESRAAQPANARGAHSVPSAVPSETSFFLSVAQATGTPPMVIRADMRAQASTLRGLARAGIIRLSPSDVEMLIRVITPDFNVDFRVLRLLRPSVDLKPWQGALCLVTTMRGRALRYEHFQHTMHTGN